MVSELDGFGQVFSLADAPALALTAAALRARAAIKEPNDD